VAAAVQRTGVGKHPCWLDAQVTRSSATA
jgi:hypothetical protein